MKKTALALLVTLVMLLQALPAGAQGDVRLTMTFQNETLPEALLRLEKNSSYKFLFTYDDCSKYRVTGKMRNARLLDIVAFLLKDTPLHYSVNGKFINITKKGKDPNKVSQTKLQTIGGYVYDEQTKEPIIGAQVKVLGTPVVAVTDVNGAFSFEYYLTGEYRLQVSYVGMQTVTMPMQKQMTIAMKEDSHNLKGVVVTGIFRKAKESYTGSVSTVTREQLDNYRGSNLLQTLKNVDASINFSIDNLNGSNPNNLPNINIRGNSSLPMSVEEFNAGEKSNPNTPLVIMDGFEISLQKLMDYNDEEIESINILKDAAATAIYGSKGANGVIVVVSKQPEEGRLKVNVEAGLQLQIPDISSYHLLNAADKLELERRAGLYDRAYQIDGQQELLLKEAYQSRLRDVLAGMNTNWISKPLHTGVGQRYNARLQGGSKEFRWSTDLQYNDIQGAMRGSFRKNFNGAITLIYKYKTLTFRNYTSVGINHSKESPYGTFSNYVDQEPYNSPYDENGNLRRTLKPFYAWASIPANPLYNAKLGGFNKSNYQELTNNFSIDWNILPELTLRGQLGISKNDSESDFFRSPEDSWYDETEQSEYQSGDGYLRRGFYRYGNGKTTNFNTELTLAYSKVFNDVHSLYAGLNWSLLTRNYDYFSSAYEGIASDDFAKIGNARQYAKNELPSGTNTRQHQFGVTGNVNYTYNSRYYVDLSYRIDGNSTYGSDKKYASFWSAGLGWNVHQERWFKNRIVNMLRLKGSYGETGAASGALETDAYTYYNYVTDNHYMNWTGAQLGGWGNPNLSWQTTKELNIGTEFGLLDNRIKGTFEVYTKKTDDLLSSMDLPLSMGFSSYRANIGSVKNRGWEAALNVYVIRDEARRLNWMVGGQMVYNHNEISSLSQAIKNQTVAYMLNDADTSDDSYSGIQSLFFEGYPQNSIWAVRSAGIDPSTGREIYYDKNGNITDTWHASDKVYCGSADPKYRGNLNTMVQWGDFTANVSFGYYWGGKMYNSTLRDRVEVTTSEIQYRNVDERVLSQRWYQAGDVTFFQGLSNNKSRATSRYVMDNNVLELQSVSLQYKLHNPWLQKNFRLETMIFAINANDLVHWGSIRMERGTSYPFARNVMGSIKLMF